MFFIGNSADELYIQALTALSHAREQPSRIELTKELTHVMFQLNDPRQRLLSLRDINPAFAFVEVLWILAGGNNVQYLRFWNKRMNDFTTPPFSGNLLHGAYGYRLGANIHWLAAFGEGEIANALYTRNLDMAYRDQLGRAYYTLDHNPESRQVCLQIWDARFDMPDYEGRSAAPDVPCNVLSHLMIREGKLHWTQIMRSNDAVWGWPYNVVQWTFLQEILAGWLNIDVGPFVLVSDSFHVYQKHWANISQILSRPSVGVHAPLTYSCNYTDYKISFRCMIEVAWHLATCKLGEEDAFLDACNGVVSDQFMGLMRMLQAEALRIKGDRDTALRVAMDSNYIDNYWFSAWLRWFSAKEKGVIL